MGTESMIVETTLKVRLEAFPVPACIRTSIEGKGQEAHLIFLSNLDVKTLEKLGWVASVININHPESLS